MSPILCWGEVLWDLLPHGRFLGGAPFNVVYHLHRLGHPARLLSAVGDDALGRAVRDRCTALGIDVSGIRMTPGVPTGTVEVTLDHEGQPRYEIVTNVAWDAIVPDAGALAAASHSFLVYGTLAQRGVANRTALGTLLARRPEWTVCDLNLRTPFDDLATLEPLVSAARLLKLNADEARRLAPSSTPQTPADQATAIAQRYGCEVVCVTLGAEGALVRHAGGFARASAPAVRVRDAIGAGDAFTAAVIAGLRENPSPDWPALLARACRLGAFVASQRGAQPDYRVRPDGEIVVTAQELSSQ